MNQIVPIPKIPITVRLATLDDLSFIDALQKKHSKQLGFFPRAQMEGYLKNEWVLIAEESGSPVGYCASRDRYQKRDELGAVFQLCVSDQVQRKLVGATLIKSVFERAPYGCKLFCCWCAQDLEANRFWESMGFIPLAFRAGSRGSGCRPQARVHIFWQRRIRQGDTQTPYWFPSQTNAGSIREDRLVLPIPPGVGWRDVMPVVLPSEANPKLEASNHKQIGKSKGRNGTPKLLPPTTRRMQFGRPSMKVPSPSAPLPEEKKEKPKREKIKNDPKLVAGARELRDRWLERINSGTPELPEPQGKYEISRDIEGDAITVHTPKLLAA